jgi:Uri superfamily endonuclease
MPKDLIKGHLLSLRQPGTYMLILRVSEPAQLDVGRMAHVSLSAGRYGYIGSALGAGGLGGRLQRHLGTIAKPHWHIDYLRAVAQWEQVWVCAQAQGREHAWAKLLVQWPDVSVAVPAFGTSDCRCATHLFRWESSPNVHRFQRRVREHFPRDAPVLAFRNPLHNEEIRPLIRSPSYAPAYLRRMK